MNKTFRTIVVEDERLPRLSLIQKLEGYRPQIEVIDSCDSYDSALQSILRNQPDLLFLDIQLQGRDAIQLLEEVKKTIPLPRIIFTTAYADRKYLMSAIKLAAADYLLKPIDKNELALAISKVIQSDDRADDPSQQGPTTGKLSFRTVNGKVYINTDDIAYIRADGNYSNVVAFHTQETVLESLATLEDLLDNTIFVRVDRSTVVNIKNIYKLNTKRRLCTFRSADGADIETELSKVGINLLMDIL